MKSTDFSKQQLLNKIFPELETLLEHEQDTKNLGYNSIAISIFDHWLSRKEYDIIFAGDTNHLKQTSLSKRLSFFKAITYPKFEYYSEIFKEFQSNDDFLIYYRQKMEKNTLMDIAIPKLHLFIEGCDDYTDFLYYRDPKMFHYIKKAINESGLQIIK